MLVFSFQAVYLTYCLLFILVFLGYPNLTNANIILESGQPVTDTAFLQDGFVQIEYGIGILQPLTKYEVRVSFSGSLPLEFEMTLQSNMKPKRHLLDIEKVSFITDDTGCIVSYGSDTIAGMCSVSVLLTVSYNGISDLESLLKNKPVSFVIILEPLLWHAIPGNILFLLALCIISLAFMKAIILPWLNSIIQQRDKNN